jgi:hypothetical protein
VFSDRPAQSAGFTKRAQGPAAALQHHGDIDMGFAMLIYAVGRNGV